MKLEGSTVLNIGLVVLAFALVAAVYNQLPEYVPTHWNADGIIDRRMVKPWGPFVLPLTMAGVFAVLLVLPYISPRGYEIEPFRRAYGMIQVGILGFAFAMNVLVLLAGLGWAAPMNRLLLVGIGALLVIIGNFLGKVTTNFFVGIRTPWTLADPEVWLRTHRFAGKVIAFGGVAITIAGLLGAGLHFLTAAMFLTALVPAIYSYLVYLRLERERGRNSP
jgi:uncharacterized membrane protein